ncbi:MAG: hypothetical protein DCC58_21200 [Chloroflexi bacterium]|nr:MAG: hypothetical protein DCC58_21200 [Chloroflexota bacterium]
MAYDPRSARTTEMEVMMPSHARYITASRLIDGTGRAPIEDAVVVVEHERIVAVGARSAIRIPDGAQEIAMGERTLLPGFVDAHSHITINPGLRGIIGQLEGLNEPRERQVLRGARNLRLDLASGVTTMRIVGEVPYTDVVVRQAIEDGFIVGPRLLISGRAITSSNGHGSLVPQWIVDGADEMRRVVREQLRHRPALCAQRSRVPWFHRSRNCCGDRGDAPCRTEDRCTPAGRPRYRVAVMPQARP